MSYNLTLLEEITSSIEDMESNTITIACLYISKQYIRSSKKQTESSFSHLNLHQDKLYLKLLVLTFLNCRDHLKFEETGDIIEAWLDNNEIELPRFHDMMNPELKYEDIYDAFELNSKEKEILKEMEEIERIFKKHDEKSQNKKQQALKNIEENVTKDKFSLVWLFGYNIWKTLYVLFISVVICGCFILLFTGFSLSGKLDALDKDDDSFIEESESNNNNYSNNKKQVNDKK